MSSSSSKPFPEASKNLFGPSFVEKVKKRNETVTILSSAGSTKSQHAVFRRGNSSQFRPGRRVSFVGDHQTSYQASYPEDETHISGGQSRAKFPATQPRENNAPYQSNRCVPVKYVRYAANKRKPNLSNSKVSVRQFRPLFCRANHLPIAGRLQYFGKNWQVVTNDTWVLAAISGYCIPFTSILHQEILSSHTVSSED